MAELLKSITDARKSLREISETAQTCMDRYIITNQGQPQSVLLGYKEYQGLKATVELMNRPEVMARLQTGLQQLNRGERLTFDEMRQNLQRRRVQQADGTPSFGEVGDVNYIVEFKPQANPGDQTNPEDMGKLQQLLADLSPKRLTPPSQLRAGKIAVAPVKHKANV